MLQSGNFKPHSNKEELTTGINMTIQRTREIFGSKLADKSDNEVLEFIQQTGQLCDSLLDMVLTKDLTHYKKEVYYGNSD